MITVIQSAREVHAVPTAAAYQQRHRAAIAKLQARGVRVAEHVVETPVEARIDHGRWIVDCACGAGNAVDPTWPEARCFGCGAVHPHVQFPAPPTIAALTEVLLARPQVRTRNWWPGVSLDALEDENVRHGIPRRRRVGGER